VQPCLLILSIVSCFFAKITIILLTMCDVATVQKIANCLGVNPGKVHLNEEQV